jgi:iron complex outermembrane recepter protein
MSQSTGRVPAALAGAVLLSTSIALAPQAEAQTEAQQQRERGVIEEIIVTGTKREAAVQDVPISISALSEDMLNQQFRNDILAVGELTPGVTLGVAPGFRAVAGGIRGTGQNSILVTQDSSVVLLVDEFPLTNVQAQFVELFDVERVEVYRGPQGTLFGKSATGGAISIITKRPVMNEWEAEVRAQYGMFNGSDGPSNSSITKHSVALNIPLIADTLSMRLTGIWDKDDGFYQNSKDTATFPNLVPLYEFGAPTVLDGRAISPVNPPLPPELDTRTRGTGENLNNTDVFAGKVKLLWQPTDNYEAYFMFDYLDDNSGTVPGVNESEPTMLLPLLGFPSIQQAGQKDPLITGVTNQCAGLNPDALCLIAGQRVDVRGYQLHQRLDVGDYTVRLILGHREQKEILPNSYTGEAFRSLFDASRNTTKEGTQYELRVTSNLEGPFNFVFGTSYMTEEVDMLAYATVGLSSLITVVDEDRNDGVPGDLLRPDGALNLDLDFINDPASTGARQDRDTYAFYADGSYAFTDRWTLSAGLRWTKDEKDFYRRANPGGPCTDLTPAKDQVLVEGVCLDARSNSLSRVGGDFTLSDVRAFEIPLPGTAFGINSNFSDTWDEITYRLVLDYQLADVGMVYGSYSTGFIPGGFTETCSSLETCLPFNSETNWNAEIGFKGQFLENTLQVNAAIFFTEYDDLIRSQVLPFTNAFGVTTQETVNVNAGTSEAIGAEAEVTWLARAGLTLGLSVGFIDHEYKEFVIGGVDRSNLTVPFSPKWQAAATASYEQPLTVGSLTYGLAINYQDEAEASVFNSPLTQIEERTLVDANITFRDLEQRYYVTLWGKNLTDDRHRIGANSVAGLWNFTMFGRPRSYGLEAGVTF